MTRSNTKLDAFFARPGPWRAELNALRAIVLDCPVTEELKWRQPCYTAHGGNIALIARFRDFCSLSFFKGVLLADPKGILVPPGDNSRSVRLAKFTDLAAVEAAGATLKAYLREAIELEKAGRKVDLPKDDLDYPDELTAILKRDKALKTAFQALTPGRRRGWLLHFSQPKMSETRTSRIEKAAPRIMDGKGMHDR